MMIMIYIAKQKDMTFKREEILKNWCGGCHVI